ncbi:hypothetical protein Ddye_012232 [Dipteronia dyeriana]|uniref:Uncharacterized protein n=1 Tax=Dipteronia dyeriana TaxID=168575 RepID=A0AAE0CIC1_9ROSI|nr:hypothetical protein Ddye_012232 [Dipteronia dyeriana]
MVMGGLLLDYGTILVLIPQSKACFCKIKVYGDVKTFFVNMEEDVKLLDLMWIESLLELRKNKGQVYRKATSENKGFQFCFPMKFFRQIWETEVGHFEVVEKDFTSDNRVSNEAMVCTTIKVKRIIASIKRRPYPQIARKNFGLVNVLDSDEEMMNAIIAMENGCVGNALIREGEFMQASIAMENKIVGVPILVDMEVEEVVTEVSCPKQYVRKKEKCNYNSVTKHRMRMRNSKIQCFSETVEEELAKVLQTGIAIGFDFNGAIKDLVEAITRREENDDSKFENMTEKLQRRFFWGNGIEKRKLHVVDWGTICSSKRKGVPGILRISDKNNGLLAKWVWRFDREDQSLWKRVIFTVYDVQLSSLLWKWNGV